MNFQTLLHVETADFYLDVAFRKAKEKANDAREKKFKERISKSRYVEGVRVQAVSSTLDKFLGKILLSFPNIDDLPEFYLELVKTHIDYPILKRSLGSIKWAIDKIKGFTSSYISLIMKCRDLEKINSYRREYYGRISSILKQIKDKLKFLEEARRTMKGFPTVKTSLPTVAIAGFPNVGKTTLLFKLTGSKPEINEYAFTTKNINVSYIKKGKKKIQLLDTPGTLNRLNKMNYIEKQAYLAMKLCSHMIVYVFDLTLSYPIEDQIKLYNRLKKMDLPISIYYSKTDLVKKQDINSFSKRYTGYTDPVKLKRKLLEL